MTEITISFDPQMSRAMIAGEKICTTRRSKHGERGDTFTISGTSGQEYTLKILSVIKTTLKKAIEEYYEREGFKTPDEMFKFWIEAYDIQNTYKFTREYHKQPVFLHFLIPA